MEDRASLVDDLAENAGDHLTDNVPAQRPAAPSPDDHGHEHAWRLVSVEYEDSGPVRELACERCAEVRFD